jgi:dihydrofolate reductase
MISFLFAMDQNRLIGKNNDLPWHLPNDLKFFKRLTMGQTVVMGRKTLESFKKPLPGRRNVILTRNEHYHMAGIEVLNNPEKVLELERSVRELFIIGGSEIFDLFLPHADRLYVTLLEETFEGDAYFNGFNEKHWKLVSERIGVTDEKNIYPHRFQTFDRIK